MKLPSEWLKKIESREQAIGLAPEEYFQCFVDALGKMSETLNGEADLFTIKPLTVHSDKAKTELAAENFFCWFDYGKSSRGKTKFNFTLTQPFFTLSYDGLYCNEKLRQKTDLKAFMNDCATNYILKYCWHTYVHNKLQRITQHNYEDFDGEPTYTSDFEADNLATILLAISYNHKISTCSTRAGYADRKIITLLERNRCNKVFGLREDKLKTKRTKNQTNYRNSSNALDEYLTSEWMNRRRLAVYLSGWLLASGRAAASISMHAFGKLRVTQNGVHRSPRAVGIQISDIHLVEPGVESVKLAGTIDENLRELSSWIDGKYRTALLNDSSLGKYATVALTNRLNRLGINGDQYMKHKT